MRQIYIVGSKGFGNYGGYETFVDKLTEYHKNIQDIKYYVFCKGKENGTFSHHNAVGVNIKVANIGPAQAILYDVQALRWCIRHIKQNQVNKPIIYILACRIGPFMRHYVKCIHKMGGTVYVNPDGHEWKRAKWSAPVRKYWKISEQLMVKHSDLLVCDSKNIEKYIKNTYRKYLPKTTFIAYGADLIESQLSDEDMLFTTWLKEKDVTPHEYYIIVGRFVPENNYEIMIREFMKSSSQKDLVIITTYNQKYYDELQYRLNFENDKRIKFVGTVYDQELLKKIRENAYGYLHGHEVGGTNPSLLEALGSTQLNLLVDVGFNIEVAQDAALYWGKEEGQLKKIIEYSDHMEKEDYMKYGDKAKLRIKEEYSWQLIADKYLNLFKQWD